MEDETGSGNCDFLYEVALVSPWPASAHPMEVAATRTGRSTLSRGMRARMHICEPWHCGDA